jgi:HEAT repeat protein
MLAYRTPSLADLDRVRALREDPDPAVRREADRTLRALEPRVR